MKEAEDPIVQLAAFRVGGEEYVVDIMRVREIIRPQVLTPVRKGPRFVEGVLNLRGAVIPVVDLRRRFDLPPSEAPGRKIVILAVQARIIGLMVDNVTEVVRVPKSSIRPAPGLLDPRAAPFFLGVCHHKGRTLVLLNIRNVVAHDGPIPTPNPNPVEPAA
jgi:purine-binding chemotaxis protein CheW